MCGIVAVINADTKSKKAPIQIHDALYQLQHRGQDAAGMVTCSEGKFFQCKGNGLVSTVFSDVSVMEKLAGYMGVGHLRYPTAGTSDRAEAQPFYVNGPYGIVLTHNGNLTNAAALREYLDQVAHRYINTESDSELLLNIFASELEVTGKARVNAADCFSALERVYKRLQGAWSCTAMIAGFGIIGFRDPHGIRPLVLGSRAVEDGNGYDYMLASESAGLSLFDCPTYSDILPGQAVIIEKGKAPVFHQVHDALGYTPDIFEYVYFARQDSIIDGIYVDDSRRKMGYKLAETIKHQLGSALAEVDVIIPIPSTGANSAYAVAEGLGKPFREGFVKNSFVNRTFIMPSQQIRRSKVRAKLTPKRRDFDGKTVILVDDSIVRGTTSSELVRMARESGAKRVYLASCAPPVTHAHVYGIDLAQSELVATNRDSSQIAKHIGADAVFYQTLPDLIDACASLSPRDPATQKFEVGVFNGTYVTPVDDAYLRHLEDVRKMSNRSAPNGHSDGHSNSNSTGQANGHASGPTDGGLIGPELGLHNLADGH